MAQNDILIGKEVAAGTYLVSSKTGNKARLRVIDLRKKPYHGVVRNVENYEKKMSNLPVQAQKIVRQANQEGKGVVWEDADNRFEFAPSSEEMISSRMTLLNKNKERIASVAKAGIDLLQFFKRSLELTPIQQQNDNNLNEQSQNSTAVPSKIDSRDS